MLIYLVQAGGSLDGSDGYSYGLLHGEQRRLLVSFVDFMRTGNQTLHRADRNKDRRVLAKRALAPSDPEPS